MIGEEFTQLRLDLGELRIDRHAVGRGDDPRDRDLGSLPPASAAGEGAARVRIPNRIRTRARRRPHCESQTFVRVVLIAGRSLPGSSARRRPDRPRCRSISATLVTRNPSRSPTMTAADPGRSRSRRPPERVAAAGTCAPFGRLRGGLGTAAVDEEEQEGRRLRQSEERDRRVPRGVRGPERAGPRGLGRVPGQLPGEPGQNHIPFRRRRFDRAARPEAAEVGVPLGPRRAPGGSGSGDRRAGPVPGRRGAGKFPDDVNATHGMPPPAGPGIPIRSGPFQLI